MGGFFFFTGGWCFLGFFLGFFWVFCFIFFFICFVLGHALDSINLISSETTGGVQGSQLISVCLRCRHTKNKSKLLKGAMNQPFSSNLTQQRERQTTNRIFWAKTAPAESKNTVLVYKTPGRPQLERHIKLKQCSRRLKSV